MRAVVLEGPQKSLKIEERKRPNPGPGEVLLESMPASMPRRPDGPAGRISIRVLSDRPRARGSRSRRGDR